MRGDTERKREWGQKRGLAAERARRASMGRVSEQMCRSPGFWSLRLIRNARRSITSVSPIIMACVTVARTHTHIHRLTHTYTHKDTHAQCSNNKNTQKRERVKTETGHTHKAVSLHMHICLLYYNSSHWLTNSFAAFHYPLITLTNTLLYAPTQTNTVTDTHSSGAVSQSHDAPCWVIWHIACHVRMHSFNTSCHLPLPWHWTVTVPKKGAGQLRREREGETQRERERHREKERGGGEWQREREK